MTKYLISGHRIERVEVERETAAYVFLAVPSDAKQPDVLDGSAKEAKAGRYFDTYLEARTAIIGQEVEAHQSALVALDAAYSAKVKAEQALRSAGAISMDEPQ